MPVLDGYEATRILRTGSEYALEPDPDSTKGSGTKTTSTSNNTHEKGKEKQSKQELLRDIPVIAMTASAIQGNREKCHEAGMDDYLAKPVEKARLEEMLVKWAGRKRGG